MPKKSQRKQKTSPKLHQRTMHHVKRAGKFVHKHASPHARRAKSWYQRQNILTKLAVWLIVIVLFLVSCMYGVAQWYIYSNKSKPMQVGATFIPDYAKYFGLDPQETLDAIINDLGMRRLRFVSYWKHIEPKKGHYDFSELDWQFKMAEQSHAQVSLAIGLRQPRWPECHQPEWAKGESKDVWYPQLKKYMAAVVNRYKNSPALESYQLENEYFLRVFGKCTDFDRDRLVDEYNMVKQLDPNHKLVVSRSNNAIGIPINEPIPDESAVSVYKRVWDRTLTRRYFEFPFPAWFYAFLAGTGKLVNGKDMFIHELQAEPWLPDGFSLNSAPIEEQDKSMNAQRLKDRFEFGAATGIRTMDMWGVEWWYARKIKNNDPSLWNAAKDELKKLTMPDKQCANPESTIPASHSGNSKSPC